MELGFNQLNFQNNNSIHLIIHTGRLIQYKSAMAEMNAMVDEAITTSGSLQHIWFLEHDHVYTVGTGVTQEELSSETASGIDVYRTKRGGRVTYHGPGQRIIYFVLDLKKLHNGTPDIRMFIYQLEQLIIEALKSAFDINAFRLEGMHGVWINSKSHTNQSSKPAKIAAIGVHVQKWVTMHGVALNISPDLSKYSAITPCGITDYGVTSLAEFTGQFHEVSALDSTILNLCGLGIPNNSTI